MSKDFASKKIYTLEEVLAKAIIDKISTPEAICRAADGIEFPGIRLTLKEDDKRGQESGFSKETVLAAARIAFNEVRALGHSPHVSMNASEEYALLYGNKGYSKPTEDEQISWTMKDLNISREEAIKFRAESRRVSERTKEFYAQRIKKEAFDKTIIGRLIFAYRKNVRWIRSRIWRWKLRNFHSIRAKDGRIGRIRAEIGYIIGVDKRPKRAKYADPSCFTNLQSTGKTEIPTIDKSYETFAQSYRALQSKCDQFFAKHEKEGFADVSTKEWEVYSSWLVRQSEIHAKMMECFP